MLKLRSVKAAAKTALFVLGPLIALSAKRTTFLLMVYALAAALSIALGSVLDAKLTSTGLVPSVWRAQL